MALRTIGIILNGATGRICSTQHVANALVPIRDEGGLPAGIVLDTKVGYNPAPFDYSAEAARRGLAASLERLGLSRVDLVDIHDTAATPPALWEELAMAMADFNPPDVVGVSEPRQGTFATEAQRRQ